MAKWFHAWWSSAFLDLCGSISPCFRRLAKSILAPCTVLILWYRAWLNILHCLWVYFAWLCPARPYFILCQELYCTVLLPCLCARQRNGQREAGERAESYQEMAPSWPGMAQVTTEPLHRRAPKLGCEKWQTQGKADEGKQTVNSILSSALCHHSY